MGTTTVAPDQQRREEAEGDMYDWRALRAGQGGHSSSMSPWAAAGIDVESLDAVQGQLSGP